MSRLWPPSPPDALVPPLPADDSASGELSPLHAKVLDWLGEEGAVPGGADAAQGSGGPAPALPGLRASLGSTGASGDLEEILALGRGARPAVGLAGSSSLGLAAPEQAAGLGDTSASGDAAGASATPVRPPRGAAASAGGLGDSLAELRASRSGSATRARGEA
ncbi:unnamed protein product, partial [Prorocentrum cordatum]